jgi:phenylacetate-CoA ligase
MNWMKTFVCNIGFPVLSPKENFKEIYKQIICLEENQYGNLDILLEKQLYNLKNILVHSFETTKYYKKIFMESGFNPYRFNDFSTLKKIPLLNKNIIRDFSKDLITTNLKESELHWSETGGTTGVKMRFWRDNACMVKKEAALYRFEKWTGWDFGDWVGIVWPAQADYVGHWTLKSQIRNAMTRRQVVFPAAVIDDQSIKEYIDLLVKRKPTAIRAFSSPLYEVAQYILRNNCPVRGIKGIITTGEPLFEFQRKTIEEAFGAQVLNSYRTREAGPIAQECEKQDGLHINSDGLYIELIDEEKDPFNGQFISKIVITDLWNYGMPLIRYDIGDYGSFLKGQCTCGRVLPRLGNIAGRVADTLVTPTNRRVSAGSLVLYLVDEAPGLIGQVQVVQDALDHLIIRVTKDPPVTEEIKNYQLQTIHRLFGQEMKVTFEEVERIDRERTGKYRFTISSLSN